MEDQVKIAQEVFGVSEKEIKPNHRLYIDMADIMISILNYTPEQVKRFMIMLSKIDVSIKIEKELPDDCKETVKNIKEIIKWHGANYATCTADLLVEKYNELVSQKATLSELSAWYSTQATMATLNRRNWRAGIFSALRTFGRDMETNIRKKTTVTDTEEQAEMLSFINIKKQVYFAYVAETLENLKRDCRDILNGIKERLIEIRNQRQTEYPTTK